MGARRQESPKRCSGEVGAALVEMAFILAPLCLFLFGIIVYGYLMSFRQNMTQAAAEGARAGAIAPASPGNAKAMNDARTATDQALTAFGESCDNGRMTCTVVVTNCPAPSAQTCVTVTIDYDYEHNPLMPNVPIVSAAIPSTFTSSSTAQVNS